MRFADRDRRSRSNGAPPSLLLVDDDEFLIQVLAARLDSDFVVHIAHNGRLALQMHSSTPYSVILSDFRMPEMNGLELFQEVCRSCEPRLFVLMSSDEQLECPSRVRFLGKGHGPEFIVQRMREYRGWLIGGPPPINRP